MYQFQQPTYFETMGHQGKSQLMCRQKKKKKKTVTLSSFKIKGKKRAARATLFSLSLVALSNRKAAGLGKNRLNVCTEIRTSNPLTFKV